VDGITRRELLARALMAGSGTTIVAAFGPKIAEGAVRPAHAAARFRADPIVIDLNFVAGRLVDRSADLFIVLDPDAQFRRVRMAPSGQVWKQGQWNQGVLQVGDCIYARGKVGPDGVLAINKAWASIFNLEGRLIQSGARTFLIDLLRADIGPAEISFAPGAEMTDGSSAAVVIGSLPAGAELRVVGFESPATGELAATLVAGPAHGGPSHEEADTAQAPSTASTSVVKYGVASWQCCGGVNGCGSQCCSCVPARCCPPSSQKGSCGTCRTDQQGVAWPNLTNGCSAVCSSCCVPMDRLACGQIVTICNMCSPNYCCAIPVNDCGPNLRCVAATRCKGYQVVKWDLTACTFTCCGGNLDAGFIDSQASYFI
jgi:hypothetical protein